MAAEESGKGKQSSKLSDSMCADQYAASLKCQRPRPPHPCCSRAPSPKPAHAPQLPHVMNNAT